MSCLYIRVWCAYIPFQCLGHRQSNKPKSYMDCTYNMIYQDYYRVSNASHQNKDETEARNFRSSQSRNAARTNLVIKTSMTHDKYKQKMLWKRVDYDKGYSYQCVDLFKDYADKVFGIRFWKTWNANQIRTNKYKIFDKRRKKINGTLDIRQWDIIIALIWKYWHIAVIDDPSIGSVIEQNGSWKNSWNWLGANAIRLHTYPLTFRKGFWRFIW